MKRKHVSKAIEHVAAHFRQPPRSEFEKEYLPDLRPSPKPGDIIRVTPATSYSEAESVQLTPRMIAAARKRALKDAIRQNAENP